MTHDHPELEIGLHLRGTASYTVEARFPRPDDHAEARDEDYPVLFDFARLREAAADPAAYGRLLGQVLLGRPKVRSWLEGARQAAQQKEQPLRLRLCIERLDHELHALKWETLRDPETDRSLLLHEGLLFSRYLGSFDMRPLRLRSRTELRALVAVANPSNLADWRPGGRTLAPIDMAGELQRAREGLEGILLTELGTEQPVTLETILSRMCDEYDVLYLVCHGALIGGEAYLWLQDDQGGVKVTEGKELIDGLAGMPRLPRLVVLASCQSAGSGQDARSDDDGLLAALGPRLAAAGVPAVIAMQGNVLQRTVARFMPVFFRELRRDGQIDRAMTAARFAVREAPDHWAPVLYTRLINGRLWYEHQFARGRADFEAWEGLIDQVRDGTLVPVLGAGLLETYVGSPREVARRWALKSQYPMAASLHYDLPQVAQYLSTMKGKAFALNEYVRDLTGEVLRRWPDLNTPPPGGEEAPAQRLRRLLSAARGVVQRKNPAEPHRVLARLSCPVYLSTNPDDLLLDALRANGRTPQVELCRWREGDRPSAEATDQGGAPPTPARPLVYQLFGHLADRNSLVLTEDDYFQYLVGVTRLQNRPQPSVLAEKLTDAGLMFLGFRIDDWDFRVFIHFLQSLQGGKLRGLYKSVAVQLDPEEGLGADVARARRYLEKHLGASNMQIEIYWGSAEDFMQELDRQWQQQA
jgi:hypothetical protein